MVLHMATRWNTWELLKDPTSKPLRRPIHSDSLSNFTAPHKTPMDKQGEKGRNQPNLVQVRRPKAALMGLGVGERSALTIELHLSASLPTPSLPTLNLEGDQPVICSLKALALCQAHRGNPGSVSFRERSPLGLGQPSDPLCNLQ